MYACTDQKEIVFFQSLHRLFSDSPGHGCFDDRGLDGDAKPERKAGYNHTFSAICVCAVLAVVCGQDQAWSLLEFEFSLPHTPSVVREEICTPACIC